MRVVVAGGAGFLGSHLCDYLLLNQHHVVCVDNYSTGEKQNVLHLLDENNFELIEQDISKGLQIDGEVHAVLNFASPASPKDYLEQPLATLEVGSNGTKNCLELATKKNAIFLMASTSEVYGDPEVNPQPETYWGRVNPIGPRSVYDEAKRFSEALSFAYLREKNTNVKVARIFNTYGPLLRPSDGRVVSNFIYQALTNKALTVYGDGSQTRSLCFVEDEVKGLVSLMNSKITGPINVGNPQEITILELAKMILKLTNKSEDSIIFEPLPIDDPTVRRPDITRAIAELNWEPKIPLEEGLKKTIAWMEEIIK